MDIPEKITIKQFAREELAALRQEIQSALDSIKFKYGLNDLYLSSITFTENSFTGKIHASVAAKEKPSVSFGQEEEYKFYTLRNNLPQDIIGQEFISSWQNFKITRIETKNPKYPIIALCKENSKHYKFSIQRIKELCGNTKYISKIIPLIK